MPSLRTLHGQGGVRAGVGRAPAIYVSTDSAYTMHTLPRPLTRWRPYPLPFTSWRPYPYPFTS